MTSSAEPELEKVAELLLRRRLREHMGIVDQHKIRVEKDSAERRGDQVARDHLVSRWADVFQDHCQRALADLLGLVRAFDTPSSVEWIQQKFESHVDEAATELARRLANSGFRGVSSGSSLRNRFANLASMIKTSAREELRKETERARKHHEVSKSLESSPAELDDRLPLNRAATFDRDLVEMTKAVRRADEPLSLVMIDLDHFKTVNDEHGHPVGDEVLVAVSEVVTKRLGRKGKAYRYGGEEFALLLPSYSAEEAFGLAERIRKDIRAAVVSSKGLRVTASFGVACLPDDASNPKGLLEKADAALYEAKNLGRNRVRVSGNPPQDRE